MPQDWDLAGGKRYSRLWRAWSDEINLRLVRRWLGTPRRVLKTDAFDEAVGRGFRRPGMVLMDISPVVLRGAGAGVCADIRALAFRDGSFDAVLSLSTLDHFATHAEIERALAEIVRVLQPGGILVITLDNLANPIVWLRNRLLFVPLHKLGIVPYYVGATWTRRGLLAALERAGLRVDEEEAIVHFPRAAGVFLCKQAERLGGETIERFLLRHLLSWESLSAIPTRQLTAYFIAVRATKPA